MGTHNTFKCEDCNLTFSSRLDREWHNVETHESHDNPLPNPESSVSPSGQAQDKVAISLTCDQCDFQAFNSPALVKHLLGLLNQFIVKSNKLTIRGEQ